MPNSQKGRVYRQAGFAPVLIILIVATIAVVLFLPIPRYQSSTNCPLCKPGGDCPCTQKGWSFGDSLWKRIMNKYQYPTEESGTKIACTMEAKICPDGSSVGRTGSNCEFSPCPASKTTPTPIPNISSEPNGTVETTNWKTYFNTKKLYSFQYPANWEILDEIPQYYKTILFDPSLPGWKLGDWLNSKMFNDKCRGPILRDTKVNTTLIAFEIVEKNGGGTFCWSNGDFTTTYKRTIKTLASSQINVIKWRLGDYIFPVTRDNSGQKYSPEWKGDLFQQISVPVQNPKYDAIMALVYKEGTNDTAEQVYDQILSTFRFD